MNVTLDGVFGAEGSLARSITGYQPRQAQREMAAAVAKAIETRHTLVAEAGTGTGKTFAYLVPAILWGKRVIVSTGTRNLQDQLFHKDLPVVRKALAVPFQAALLKGRNNYLCLYRLEHVLAFRPGATRADLAAMEAIKRWAKHTVAGDIAEVTEVSEQSPLWPNVTSTVDNCLGQDCPNLADCHLAKARRKAAEAEVVVVNHHLLWADWALKTDGFGELLPDPDVVIVDEAHQFAETAAQFLGLALTSRQLSELADDTVMEQLKEAPDQPDCTRVAEQLEHAVAEFRLALGVDSQRAGWDELEANRDAVDKLATIRALLAEMEAVLKTAAVRGKGLESCWKRSQEAGARLAMLFDDAEHDAVRWYETHKRSFSLNRTPLDVSGEFAKFRHNSEAAWVFTSATLAVSDRFEHFTGALGLSNADTGRWESPFDYANQSLFYVPPDLPEPSARDYTQAVIDAALPVIQAAGGRTFLLFTSHQALQFAASRLKALLPYPLFVQGDQPKAALLDAFKQAGNGVLLGTASFWEGVDVKGPALSCVIIDKLPFASPSDPVLNAKLDTLKQRGVSPFGAYQLPAAVITFKQGIGRLIRDHGDRGVLMLCDPRVLSKTYGKVFLNSLPPMRRTRRLDRVQAFFAAESAFAAESSS